MEGPRALISDLDGTLLGDETALKEFAGWLQQRAGGIRLAYNSGRLFESVVEQVRRTDLPEPEAVIGGVGADIRHYPSGEPVDGWPRCLGPWDRREMQRIVGQFGELQRQPEEFQTEHKLSYYGYDLDVAFLVGLRRQLALAGCPVEVVYSSNRDLDILPAGVNKGTAAAFLAGRWQLAPRQVVVSGDTGNDASMFVHGFKGVVVDNALAELKAIRSPDVYHSLRAHAAGVLDGLRYWLDEAPASAG